MKNMKYFSKARGKLYVGNNEIIFNKVTISN